jgi:hypothetical protein
MTVRGLSACVFLLALAAVLPAQAARDASVITKLPGEGRMFHASADGSWVAGWVLQPDKTAKLIVINTNKGEKLEADASSLPGGMAWIPQLNLLYYCKAAYSDVVKINKVTYYTYDPKNKVRKKVGEVSDDQDTYVINPIAAEDGSKVFSLTIDPSLKFPTFNFFMTNQGKVKSPTKAANIGSTYDLSSDGNMLYWYLRNQKDEMNLILWDMNKLSLAGVVEYPKTIDPAQHRGDLKVDAPHKQAAVLNYSEKNPAVQIVVYNFSNPKKPYAKPVSFDQGEEVLYFDWKGFSGVLYCIVDYQGSGEMGIEEVDPVTGQRTAVYRGKEPIESVDYVPTQQTYYFSLVERPGTQKAETRLIKVK